MAEAPLLEGRCLCKRFGGVRAVENVSIAVGEGTIHAVIGPNGAGKSTFFNALSGFYAPEAGQVFFGGEDVTRVPNWRRIELGMGRTFQTPSLFPELSVADNVLVGVRSRRGLSFRFRALAKAQREALDARVRELLGFVNLTHVSERPVAELSHGSQRLCEIAMSLGTDPRIVLLDEPMAGLAEAETDRVVEVIRKLHATLGLTVLFVEHNMRVVLGLAQKISVLDRGMLLAEGDPAAIAANQTVRDAYLGKEVLDHV
jgi:branched-chain amino acid transport system ATP-binding protein